MKLGGCVVLYNPTAEVVDNIGTYLPLMEELVVVDNSTRSSEACDRIAGLDGVHYISMGGNKGIASALNVGCRVLIDNGYDVALTMDQDSRFPLEKKEEILDKVSRLLKEYALVGLNFNSWGCETDDEVTITESWITSGNFVSLQAFRSVEGFNDDLFIDYVDFDFCHRLQLAGWKLCYLNRYSLSHEIGSPIEIRLLGRTFHAMNHAPIRYYYRYRNSRYLFKADKAFYRGKYYKELFINIPKMLLYESDKKSKLRMIRRGLSDGRRGILGPYRDAAEGG